MDQKPMFEETRQQMFHRVYPVFLKQVTEAVWKQGPQAQIGCWGEEGGRTRVRALARAQARAHVREWRKKAEVPSGA